MTINTARLLHTPVVASAPLRPERIEHHGRPGFMERQDGSWICLPIQARSARSHKPKARRRLWNWLAGQLSAAATTKQGDAA